MLTGSKSRLEGRLVLAVWWPTNGGGAGLQHFAARIQQGTVRDLTFHHSEVEAINQTAEGKTNSNYTQVSIEYCAKLVRRAKSDGELIATAHSGAWSGTISQ